MDSTFILIFGVVFCFTCIFLCICAGINYYHTDNFEVEDAVINEILTRNSRKSIEFVSENMVEI